MRVVIVGGVGAGASAATRARRLDEQAEITLIERGADVSFANCGLPYHLSGEIADRSKLLVVSAERLATRFRLRVLTRHQVTKLERTEQCVHVQDLNTGTLASIPYDRLILATGAQPLLPTLPGIELAGVFTLRTLADMDRIKARLQQGVRRAVVVGAGFIGLEMVESLKALGIEVSLVEHNEQILPPFDVEMTAPLLRALQAQNIRLCLGASAQSIVKTSAGLEVVLHTGQTLPADVVILGIGVKPESDLAQAAGLLLGTRGGVKVNPELRTSDPNIWAAGDCIEVWDPVFGEPAQIPLAGPANRQGRIAAENALGGKVRFRGTQGTAILRLFEQTAACTGFSEKALRRAKRAYAKVYVHPAHHAGYFPGAEQLTIKLLFDARQGTLWGAQIVGKAGVDKRIDVLSLALQAGLKVQDLQEAELAYAPPYGSAKDPINMAGFVATGMLQGTHPQLAWDVWLALAEETRPLLLDVRTAEEFQKGHVHGAVNIPVDELRQNFDKVRELAGKQLGEGRPASQEMPTIAVYCQVGQRGYLATRILQQHQLNAVNLSGGYLTYRMWQDVRPPAVTIS